MKVFYVRGGGLEGSRNDVSFRGYQAKGDEKRQRGGVIKSEKWADVVYGWPLIHLPKVSGENPLYILCYGGPASMFFLILLF